MSTSDYSVYDTQTGQAVASERFARLILSPHVVGWCLQIGLWGVTLSASTSYIGSGLWGRDPRSRKALILFVLFFCTLQTGMNFYLLVYWSTQQDRSALTILKPSVVNALQPISVLLTGVPVQVFLVSRATRLLKSVWARRISYAFFGFLITVQAFFQFFNTTLNYLFNGGKLTGELLSIVTYNIDSGIWLISSALVDVGVTAILVIVLKKKIGDGFAHTDSLLKRLMSLSIESASYTAVLAVLAVIVTYSLPSDKLEFTSIPFVFWYLLPCCYPLSLITALNSRLIFTKDGLSSDFSGQSNGVPLVRLANPNSGGSGCACAHRHNSSIKNNRASRCRAQVGMLSGVQVNEVVSVVVDTGSEERTPRTPTTRFAVHSLTIQEDKMEKGGSDWDSEEGEKRHGI